MNQASRITPEPEGYMWNYCKKRGCKSNVYVNGVCYLCALKSQEHRRQFAAFFEDINEGLVLTVAAVVGAVIISVAVAFFLWIV